MFYYFYFYYYCIYIFIIVKTFSTCYLTFFNSSMFSDVYFGVHMYFFNVIYRHFLAKTIFMTQVRLLFCYFSPHACVYVKGSALLHEKMLKQTS